MTHGEAWFKLKKLSSVDMSSAQAGLGYAHLPERMDPKEAVVYYNSKLFKYWRELLDVKEEYKHKALALLMFKTLDAQKIKVQKELLDDITSPVKPR